MSEVSFADGKIVHAPEGATILGAGEVDEETLDRALNRAPTLVAADGGARTAIEQGRMPQAVIGDLDSLADAVKDAVPPGRIHRIPEQDTTDFAKCIRSIDSPFLVGVGVTGPRLDHGLAALNSLAVNPGRRIVLLTGTDLCFLCPPAFEVELPVGSRLSLFPIGQVAGTSSGLEWGIDGLRFSPDGMSGTSNRVSRGQVSVSFCEPKMLMILPATHFDNVAGRLMETELW